MLDKVNLADAAASLATQWVPETVAAYNGDHVQVVRMQGDYVWHFHERTDDLFLCVAGRIRIELRERSVELGPGEIFVVPVGVEHRVCVDEGEALVCVIEHLGDIPAGDAGPSVAGAPVLGGQAGG